jgi:hypothetical protein
VIVKECLCFKGRDTRGDAVGSRPLTDVAYVSDGRRESRPARDEQVSAHHAAFGQRAHCLHAENIGRRRFGWEKDEKPLYLHNRNCDLFSNIINTSNSVASSEQPLSTHISRDPARITISGRPCTTSPRYCHLQYHRNIQQREKARSSVSRAHSTTLFFEKRHSHHPKWTT